MAIEAALIKIGGSALVRIAPKGLSWIRTRLVGKRILVVGPGRAGKTSFIEYVRHGVLGHVTASVVPTQETQIAHSIFKISVGTEKTLELEVKELIDTAGQSGPRSHAEQVERLKPHAIVVVLSVDLPWFAAYGNENSCIKNWLEIFFSDLLNQASRRKHVPRYVSILINKCDMLTPKQFIVRHSQIRKLAERMMPNLEDGRRCNFDLFPTVLVSRMTDKNPELSLVDHAIVAIARNLYRDGS